ncbi:MAG: YndM family protein [Clostridia bacterium]|nr:YndM family protein [Clostridia bacterium]
MKHVYALLIKFIVSAAALEVILGFLTTVSYVNILLIALAVTLISYFIGDLGVLKRTNNTIATITDFVMALLLILAFDALLGPADITLFDAMFAALAVAASEWIFHRYVARSLKLARR